MYREEFWVMRSRGYLLIFRYDDGRRYSQHDVPDGTVTALDITFPGLSKFDTITGSFLPFDNVWTLLASNLPPTRGNGTLRLAFTTTHTPASLVGFDGGSIATNAEVVITQSEGTPIYRELSGSITPVPEPSSLALLGGGVLVFVQGLRRKLM
jgi:hypothetical protein